MQLACIATRATLCVYSNEDANLAENVHSLTGMRPSSVRENKRRTFAGFNVPRYCWLLTSEDNVESLDVAEHIRWILQQVKSNTSLRVLRGAGYEIKLSCYWVSGGQGGGPVLSAELLRELADHELAIEFDVYFEDVERH